jgi:hypothetical protein
MYSLDLLELKNIGSVTEQEFWKYYISLMYLFSDESIPDRELELLSYTLSLDPRVTIYSGEMCKQAMEDLAISRSGLNNLRKGLVDKGFVRRADDIRGDWILTEHMENIQTYYKKKFAEGGGFEIRLPFIIQ